MAPTRKRAAEKADRGPSLIVEGRTREGQEIHRHGVKGYLAIPLLAVDCLLIIPPPLRRVETISVLSLSVHSSLEIQWRALRIIINILDRSSPNSGSILVCRSAPSIGRFTFTRGRMEKEQHA